MPCYDVDLDILPLSVAACHGQPVTYDLRITNTGFYADDYLLSLYNLDIGPERSEFSLGSGQTDSTQLTIVGTWCATEDISFSALARGRASDREDASLSFLPKGDVCADLDLVPSQAPKQIDCGGDTYTFYVKNTGYTKQEVSLYLSSSEQFIMQPDTVVLKPYESRPISIYLLSDGLEGKIPINIMAESEYRRAYLNLEADFTGPVCLVTRPEIIIPPAEQADEPVINQSQDDSPTAAIVAGDVELVLVAALIVVTILILTFLLFSSSSVKAKREFDFPELDSGPSSDTERLASIREAVSKTSK
jgi:hypothetical protein